MARIDAPRRTSDQARRVRDLLRASMISDQIVGPLPSEEELRAEFAVSRACVREALDLLRTEGFVTRVRGRGTFVADGRLLTSLQEAHGTEDPTEDSMWRGRMHTAIIDWSDVPATAPVARLLRIAPGETVLRVDYVAYLDGVAIGGATNHLTYPEAAVLTPDMMRVDFYAMLQQGGIAVGESTFLIDTALADRYDADLLDMRVGDPVVVLEQVIYDPAGRPVDAAFCRSCATRTTMFSRISRFPGRGQR